MIICGTFLILKHEFFDKKRRCKSRGYCVHLIIKLFRFKQSIIKQLNDDEDVDDDVIKCAYLYFVSLNHKTVWWTQIRNFRVVLPHRHRIFTLLDKTDKDKKKNRENQYHLFGSNFKYHSPSPVILGGIVLKRVHTIAAEYSWSNCRMRLREVLNKEAVLIGESLLCLTNCHL